MTVPAHVFQTATKFAVESIPGTKEVIVNPLPASGIVVDYQGVEKEVHEAFGQSSDVLQSQEKLANRHPISLEFLVHPGGNFLANCVRTAGVLPSLTFSFTKNPLYRDDLWGAKCNSLALSSAQRSPLTARTEWIAMHAARNEAADTWTTPEYRPYIWAKGVWSLAGYPVGIDIALENNIVEHYAMYTSLVGDDTDYDPTHLLPGFMGVTAQIRALVPYDFGADIDNIEATLQFTSPRVGYTLTIALEGGLYRAERVSIGRDGAAEFGIPIVFRNMTISESA